MSQDDLDIELEKRSPGENTSPRNDVGILPNKLSTALKDLFENKDIKAIREINKGPPFQSQRHARLE
jgi:hypothetical protein